MRKGLSKLYKQERHRKGKHNLGKRESMELIAGLLCLQLRPTQVRVSLVMQTGQENAGQGLLKYKSKLNINKLKEGRTKQKQSHQVFMFV